MNLDEQSMPLDLNPDPLPRSVKVRSTCNACQQAKIRCSHEKPSCHRCQKQRINCVYSMSRRLGRPAKKRSQHSPGDSNREEREERMRREKKRKKKKSDNEKSTDTKKNIDDPEKGTDADPISSSSSSSSLSSLSSESSPSSSSDHHHNCHHARAPVAVDNTAVGETFQTPAESDPMNMVSSNFSGK